MKKIMYRISVAALSSLMMVSAVCPSFAQSDSSYMDELRKPNEARVYALKENVSKDPILGWVKKPEGFYNVNPDGSFKTGWQFISGHWYYFNTDEDAGQTGVMRTGWLLKNGKWYFLNPKGFDDGSAGNEHTEGAMEHGWVEINYFNYYFDSTGALVETKNQELRDQRHSNHSRSSSRVEDKNKSDVKASDDKKPSESTKNSEKSDSENGSDSKPRDAEDSGKDDGDKDSEGGSSSDDEEHGGNSGSTESGGSSNDKESESTGKESGSDEKDEGGNSGSSDSGIDEAGSSAGSSDEGNTSGGSEGSESGGSSGSSEGGNTGSGNETGSGDGSEKSDGGSGSGTEGNADASKEEQEILDSISGEGLDNNKITMNPKSESPAKLTLSNTEKADKNPSLSITDSTASVFDEDVASVEVKKTADNKYTFTITPKSEGKTTVTITVTFENGDTASVDIEIEVKGSTESGGDAGSSGAGEGTDSGTDTSDGGSTSTGEGAGSGSGTSDESTGTGEETGSGTGTSEKGNTGTGGGEDGTGAPADGGQNADGKTGEDSHKEETIAYIKARPLNGSVPKPITSFITDFDAEHKAASFSRSEKAPSDADNAIDISDGNDGSVMLWMDGEDLKIYSPEDKISVKDGNMQNMFYNFHGSSIDISSFDTSNVTNMSGMFRDCTKASEIIFPETFDTKNVTDMSRMFANAGEYANLETIDLPDSFDTSNVKDMSSMFSGSGIKHIELPQSFDTSNTERMFGMFNWCTKLKSITLSDSFDTSNADTVGRMFNQCSSLETIKASKNFVVNGRINTDSIDEMFGGCVKLTGGNGTKYDKTADGRTYARIDNPSSGKPGYFTGIDGADGGDSDRTETDDSKKPETFAEIKSGNIMKMIESKLKTDPRIFMRSKEAPAEGVETVDISKAGDGSVLLFEDGYRVKWYSEADALKIRNAANMFNSSYCSKCSTLRAVDLAGMDFSECTDASCMFGSLRNLKSVGGLDFPNPTVKSTNHMFFYCTSLENVDMSHFNGEGVTNADGMFRICEKLKAVDLSGCNFSNLKNAGRMFEQCKALADVDVSSFDTSNIESLYRMFYDCESLTKLDISGFDTSKVTNMEGMLWACGKLIRVYVSDKFTTEKVNSGYQMMYNCRSIVGGHGTTFNSKKIHTDYARIDDPDNGKPGYFTDIKDKK